MLIIMLPNQGLRADLPSVCSKTNTIPATWSTQTYCHFIKFPFTTPICCKFRTLFLWILPYVILQIDILKDPWSQRGCHSVWIPYTRFSVVPCAYFVCNVHLLTKLSCHSLALRDSELFESCDLDLFIIMLSVSSTVPQS